MSLEKQTYRLLKSIPFLKDNTPSANLILILGLVAFILIFVDLHTEMARDKDEISSIVEVLENSEENVTAGKSISIILDLSLVYTLETFDELIKSTEPEIIYLGRSPPSFYS